jgi:hypothetical protein
MKLAFFVVAMLSASRPAVPDDATNPQASRLDRVEVTSNRFQQVLQESPDTISVLLSFP